MALVDSLLSAIVRADGDALVMHVGERPYVVVGTLTINISTHGLNLEAMTGMLAQLLPADAQTQLEEFGAVEYRIPQQGDDRFSVVAARGGDDIWIEIRRRRPAAVAEPEPASAPELREEAVADAVPPQIETPVETVPAVINEPAAELIPEPVAEAAVASIPEPVPAPIEAVPAESASQAVSEPVADVTLEATPVFVQEMPVAPVAAPELAETPQQLGEAAPHVYDWMAGATTGHVDDAVAEAPAVAETAGAALAIAALEHALEPQIELVEAIEASTTDVVSALAPEPEQRRLPQRLRRSSKRLSRNNRSSSRRSNNPLRSR